MIQSQMNKFAEVYDNWNVFCQHQEFLSPYEERIYGNRLKYVMMKLEGMRAAGWTVTIKGRLTGITVVMTPKGEPAFPPNEVTIE